jgi:hypothetical protein
MKPTSPNHSGLPDQKETNMTNMTNTSTTPTVENGFDLHQKVRDWTRYLVSMEVLDLIYDELGEQKYNVVRDVIHEALVGRLDDKDWDEIQARDEAAYQQLMTWHP